MGFERQPEKAIAIRVPCITIIYRGRLLGNKPPLAADPPGLTVNLNRKEYPMHLKSHATAPTSSRRFRPPAETLFLLLIVLWIALSTTPGGALAKTPAESPGRIEDAIPAGWPVRTQILQPDPMLHFGRLANGFRYVLMHNERPDNRVSVHLFVNAGSLNENDQQQGMAHFLEHMMFNGTTHFPPGQLVRYFQRIGMQFGNDANAHTGFDETVYDVILPQGDEKHLTEGLQVMHDYASGALLLQEEIKDERGVILAEMRSRDSAGYRTLEATLAFEFPDILLSKRLPIGKTEIIQAADRPLLKTFYDAWYRPDNMVLVIVGDYDVDIADGLIQARFNDLFPRAPEVSKPSFGTLDHNGLKIFYHHEPEVGSTSVSIEVIHLQDPVNDSATKRKQRMIAHMADQIVQNRLDARLKDPDAPFTDASIASGVYLERIHYSEISADCGPGTWSQAITAIEQELRRARYYGVGDAELTRVKKDMFTALDTAVRQAPTRDSTALARSIIRDIAQEDVILSPAQEQALLAPIVEQVTRAEVEATFRENWSDHHRLVLVSGNASPAGSQAAAETAIRNVFLASAAAPVAPPALSAAKPFPYLEAPEAGAIASREEIEDLGITRIRFANGIYLNLKRTDFKQNEVLANLIFGTGRSGEPPANPGISALAEATIDDSGLGAMTVDELERALAGKRTYLDFRIAEDHFNFFADSVSDELPLLFQLVHAHLVDPGFRASALELARKRATQEYRSASRAIEGMMDVEGSRILAGGDGRFGMPPLSTLESVSLDDIRNWIAPQLAHAPLELSIVGDIDPDAVIGLAQRYLGSLPAREATVVSAARAGTPAVPAGSIHHIPVDTQIDKALVVTAWQTSDFWDIHRTRRLSVLADVFSERLREGIREKLGIAYSPYAFNRSSRAYPGYGVFQANVNASPDKTAAVQTELRAIAQSLVEDGVTADELARAIDPILTAIIQYRQTNGYWLNSVMTGAWRSPEQFDWARTFVEDYGAITTDDLDRIADTYLKPDRAAVIVIEPAVR